jgi:hypothetical protein
MLTIDELVTAYHALSPSDRKAFLRKVSRRGRVPVSRDEVYQPTWAYLEQLTTIEGEPYDEWLMNLSSEELEALGCYPKQGKLERVLAELSTRTLSLASWLRTTHGWAVYKRDGKEKFLEWATLQTKLIAIVR